jgi:hypothetical protein
MSGARDEEEMAERRGGEDDSDRGGTGTTHPHGREVYIYIY